MGAAGFIHAATPVMQGYDPNVEVPMVVNGILYMLQACKKERSIQHVMLTSTSTADASSKPKQVLAMDEKT
jgi:nucleoside-diphosphate-sugar epimerase